MLWASIMFVVLMMRLENALNTPEQMLGVL